MEFPRPREQKYDAFVHAARGVVGLDFDGTLAPIVDDPSRRTSTPGRDVLVDLAAEIAAVAVITAARPARRSAGQRAGSRIGNAIGDTGKELYLFGQYGNER